MNQEQKEFIKNIIEFEKDDAAKFADEDEKTRQRKKEAWHKYGMKEFERLGKPKNPNPPKKLTNKECSPDCFFCHPKLFKKIDQDFKKN